MPVYTCPECSTKVKKSEPVPPGKKLRCPECDTVFPVPGEKPKPAAKKPAAAPVEAERYALSSGEEDSVESKEEREKAYAPLRERFELGKRGPALLEVVKPSNYLLMCGVVTCIMGIGGGLTATWPMIFKLEKVEDSKAKKSIYFDPTTDKKVKFQELTNEELQERLVWLAGCVLYFGWGSVVCAGASKMHEVEVYWLAFLGAVMAIIGPCLPLALLFTKWANEGPEDDRMVWLGPAVILYALGVPVSIWCISTLLKEKVKQGFAEDVEVV